MKIGILGAGQLAKMLALAGTPLGIQVICLSSSPESCAREVATVLDGSWDDTALINSFLNSVDYVTYETENLPFEFVKKIANQCELRPSLEALRVTQDRLFEKEMFNQLKIPAAEYRKIDSWNDLAVAIDELHFPLVIKTRRSGYDGKGQVVIRDLNDAKKAWENLENTALIAEKWLPFEFEVSIIAARDSKGNIVFYSLVKNDHHKGILRVSHAPFEDSNLQQQAEKYITHVLSTLNYVGVMAIEFFVLNGELVANEVAPRVHNTGHWTIEGAVTSQFENHLRAIGGLPLGDTSARGMSKMINCIGIEPDLADVLAIPGAHFHTYGKTAQPGRKLGHVTLTEDNQDDLEDKFNQLDQLINHAKK